MAEPRRVAVIDIGKTNAKLALVDLESRAEIAVLKTANRPVLTGPYPHHDAEAIWRFLLDGLSTLNRQHGIDAISVTTHGATCALVEADGSLALPLLDYEHDGSAAVRDDYNAVRPDFAETGSPALPAGLNLGAQLFWLGRTFPDAFARVSAILMYPQYWAFRLCGVPANEVTSLGCHTDLWNPAAGDYSTLVDRMNWRSLFAPLRSARDALGPVLPAIAEKTRLDPATPVYCGIHDSNASLLPHLLSRSAPFAVVSTGTWVVAMAVGGMAGPLDPARDALVNVNAFGEPVPSTRFMGGREYETLTADRSGDWTKADVEAVLADGVMHMPSVQSGSGPYPKAQACWMGREPTGGERAVASAFYLAMMTATCLDLIGAKGPIIVEGPFAANSLFAAMLRAATGSAVLPQTGQATGTSIGAAVLASTRSRAPSGAPDVVIAADERWRSYALAWRQAARSLQ